MQVPERFILIDDSEADNFFHELMIRRAGFTGDVCIFDNGVDALAFLHADPLTLPTCIFLDINMPMLDGFEVAMQAMPLLNDRQTTVLMMLTSSAAEADKVRAGDIPVIKGYVTKPLTKELVQGMLGGA